MESVDPRTLRFGRSRLADRWGAGWSATWVVQTHGTDYDLVPKASRRVAVVRTIYAEADGVALKEPDPGDPHKSEFSWMTLHPFVADRTVPYAFSEWKTLENEPTSNGDDR